MIIHRDNTKRRFAKIISVSTCADIAEHAIINRSNKSGQRDLKKNDKKRLTHNDLSQPFYYQDYSV